MRVLVAMVFVGLTVVFAVGGFISGCTEGPSLTDAQRRSRQTRHYEQALKVLETLAYVKDEATGVCFAYGRDNHGSLLTVVPCEALEKARP